MQDYEKIDLVSAHSIIFFLDGSFLWLEKSIFSMIREKYQYLDNMMFLWQDRYLLESAPVCGPLSGKGDLSKDIFGREYQNLNQRFPKQNPGVPPTITRGSARNCEIYYMKLEYYI